MIRFIYTNLANCNSEIYSEAIETLDFLNRNIKTGNFMGIKQYSTEEKEYVFHKRDQYMQSPYYQGETRPQMTQIKDIRFFMPCDHCTLSALFHRYSFCFASDSPSELPKPPF